MGISQKLEETARRLGADLFGTCSLERQEGIETVPEDLLRGFASAVSIGVAIDNAAVDSILDAGGSFAYAEEYIHANKRLDEIAGALARALTAESRRALAIPASETVDRPREMGAVSHRAVARASGLGWIGKNLLLVTPEFGPRVRLATVLTDLEAPQQGEMEPACGDCTACIDACPAGALRERAGAPYPPGRSDVLDTKACRRQCDEFAEKGRAGANVCGVCVKACPAASKQNAG
jgi:epoxyqueuosine reductase